MGSSRKIAIILLLSVLIFAAFTMPVYLAYARRTFTIDAFVSEDGGGSIDPAGSIPVDNNREITFTIAPDLGYHLQALKVDGVEQPVEPYGADYTFTRVKADHTIEAIFDANADVELPPGSTADIKFTAWEDYVNPFLPGIDGITPYFEFVIVDGTFSGNVIVTVHYDDTGLSLSEEQNLRLYIGNPVDFDGDGTVNGNDVALIQKEERSTDPDLDKFDLNNDGVVDNFDESIVKEYANSGLIVNPGQDNAGEFRIPWIDITLGEPNTDNNIIIGETWHLSLFRCR